MRRVAKVLAGILGLFVVVGAVLAGAYFTGVIGAPSASVDDVGDWGNVTKEETEIVTRIQVQNPNPIALKYGGLTAEYTMYLNDVPVANGTKKGVHIGTGNDTVTLETYIDNSQLQPWWVNYVRSNETITTRVDGKVRVKFGPLSGSVAFPPMKQTLQENAAPVRSALSGAASSLEGDYTINHTVSEGPVTREVELGYEVREGWATWGTVTEERTTVLFHYRLHNPSSVVAVPAVPDGLAATIETNDVTLLKAQGDEFTVRNVDENATIAPGETRTVVFAVQMDNEKVDDWFRSHVRRGEVTQVETRFQMVFDVQGTTIRAPQGEGASYTCTFQTGILVDGQETRTTCGDAASVAP